MIQSIWYDPFHRHRNPQTKIHTCGRGGGVQENLLVFQSGNISIELGLLRTVRKFNKEELLLLNESLKSYSNWLNFRGLSKQIRSIIKLLRRYKTLLCKHFLHEQLLFSPKSDCKRSEYVFI